MVVLACEPYKYRFLERKQKSVGFVICGARGRTEKGFFDAIFVCIFTSSSVGCYQVVPESCMHFFFIVHSEFLSGEALGNI